MSSTNAIRLIQSWYSSHKIPWESYWLKPILGKRLAEHLDRTPKWVKAASKYAHNVLFLPVHHPELNPIELAWGVVKNDCAKHFQKTRDWHDVRQYLETALNEISSETCEGMYQHVRRREDFFWQIDLELEEISEDEDIIEFDENEFIEERVYHPIF